MTICPHCHREMPLTRFGVRLTDLKCRILDLIQHAGHVGITNDAINRAVFDGRVSHHTVKAHIWQINDALLDTGVRIKSVMRNGYDERPGYYVVVRSKK